jgi:tetratricopeptide (TPR) repeat protein
MQLSDQLRALEAAQGDQGALARAAVDLAYTTLSEAQRKVLKDALDAAAIPHWFDETILTAVLDVSQDDALSRLARLRTLRTVERFPARGETALNVHEAARLALRRRLAETATERFRTLSSNACRHFAHDLSPAGRIEWIFHLLSADPERGASELEALYRDWRGRARPEDRDALAVALKELEGSGLVRGRARAWTLLVIAWTRAARGESAQLTDVAKEALQLAQAAADSSAEADAQCLLGDVLQAQGQLEAAQAAYGEYLAISRRLAEQDPSNAGWQRDLAVAHSQVGGVLQARGDLGAAEAAYENSVLIFKELTERVSDNAEWAFDFEFLEYKLLSIRSQMARPKP